MLRKIYGQIVGPSQQQARQEARRNLIRKEAIVGGQLFGSVPTGHRRQFFCLDQHTWVWHEDWKDKMGQEHSRTTRYNIRPNGVIKTSDGKNYHVISPSEARNLREAVVLYYNRVMKDLYGQTV